MIRSKLYFLVSSMVFVAIVLPTNVEAAGYFTYVRAVNIDDSSQEAYDSIVKKVVANLDDQGRAAKVARYKIWDDFDGTYFYLTPLSNRSDVDKVKQAWHKAVAGLSAEDQRRLKDVEQDALDLLFESQKKFSINLKKGQFPPDELQFAVANIIELNEGKREEALELMETMFAMIRDAKIDVVVRGYEVLEGALASNLIFIIYTKDPSDYARIEGETQRAMEQHPDAESIARSAAAVGQLDNELRLILRGELSFPPTPKTTFGPTENMRRSRYSSNEAYAVGSLRTIVTAQAQFRASGIKLSDQGNPEYGTLDELFDATPPFISAATTSGQRNGYKFTFTLTRDANGSSGYTLTAEPINDVAGTRNFFIDHSGVLTWSPASEPATKDSSPLQ